MKRLLLAASALVLVLAACGGSQRVPKGVSEIDIRTLVPDVRSVTDRPRVFSRSITDPSEVERIIGWFDALKPPGTTSIACAGGLAANVTFTFRSADGAELAKANSPPAPTDACNPIHFFTLRGQQENFLVDNNQGPALIGRVKHLLGTRFRPIRGYLG